MRSLPDLPDVNVWLALSLPDHPHHGRARQYWFEESHEEIAFCRVTGLAYVRLSTQSKVMAGKPLSVPEAWQAYRAFRALPEVFFAPEPEDCEAPLGSWALKDLFGVRLWTDAYLAAFALAGGFRLVTFDSDFARFPDVERLHLKISTEP